MATGKGLRLEKNITGKSSAMKTQFSTIGILMDKYIPIRIAKKIKYDFLDGAIN